MMAFAGTLQSVAYGRLSSAMGLLTIKYVGEDYFTLKVIVVLFGFYELSLGRLIPLKSEINKVINQDKPKLVEAKELKISWTTPQKEDKIKKYNK